MYADCNYQIKFYHFFCLETTILDWDHSAFGYKSFPSYVYFTTNGLWSNFPSRFFSVIFPGPCFIWHALHVFLLQHGGLFPLNKYEYHKRLKKFRAKISSFKLFKFAFLMKNDNWTEGKKTRELLRPWSLEWVNDKSCNPIVK